MADICGEVEQLLIRFRVVRPPSPLTKSRRNWEYSSVHSRLVPKMTYQEQSFVRMTAW